MINLIEVMKMSYVDEYLKNLSPDQGAALEHIRAIVKEMLPEIIEVKSYGLPAFQYRHKVILGFAANKNFLSLYPFSGNVVDQLKDKLAGFETTSGSIHFSSEHTIPDEVVRHIIGLRLAEVRPNNFRKES